MRTIFIFGIPQHGNLGDQAIAEATTRFIEKHTDLKVVEIPMSRSQEKAEEIKALVGPDDIIAWHGGGNIGTLWPNEEEVRLSVLSKFKDNNIVLFPQSIFFDPKDKHSLERSKDVYNSLKDGTMFLREQISLEFAKKEFIDIKSKFVPDMVFSLDFKTKTTERTGAMTLFRSDKEKAVKGKDQKKIIALLDKKFERLTQSDTVVDESFESAGKRSEFLDRTFDEIASHELIVTDRLHGMIFAYITGTPCVVFENNYHKIRSTYDTWLKGCEFIKLIDSSKELEKAAEYVMKNSGQTNKIKPKEDYKSLLLSLGSGNPVVADLMATSVSIVVPVYNVEKYLDACVDSVIKQSHKNIEIILVDDGSTDSSGEKCDNWAKKDKRIKVVHKKNEGLNYARRDGFKVSTGDYITFLDSDDIFCPKNVEISLNELQNHNCDAVVYAYKEFSDKDKLNYTQHPRQKLALTKRDEVVKYCLLGEPGMEGIHFMTAWGKMYKRKLIESVDWKKSNYRSYEDNFWTPQALIAANRIAVVSDRLYFYRQNDDPKSATLGKRLVGNTKDGESVGYLELVDVLYKYYGSLANKYGVDITQQLIQSRRNIMLWRINNLIKAKMLNTENNMEYFYDEWEEYMKLCQDSEEQTQIIKGEIVALSAENKSLREKLGEYNSIKRTARRLAGNVKRRIIPDR